VLQVDYIARLIPYFALTIPFTSGAGVFVRPIQRWKNACSLQAGGKD
jgi:hypothetical protein